MFEDHYPTLVVAYFVGVGGWLMPALSRPRWPRSRRGALRTRGGVGIALVGVLGIRPLVSVVQRDPPARGGRLWAGLGAMNQIFIFAPLLLVVVLRRQSWETAWLPRRRLAVRLLLGLVLASLAVSAYSILRAGAVAPWVLWGRIRRYENVDKMVQVLVEDLTIAILFVRLAGAIGRRWTTVIVACLFAAGHIPVMVSHGAAGMTGRVAARCGAGHRGATRLATIT